MGRITLTETEKGDACDLTVTNNMMAAINTGHNGIDDQNIRRGGLDERNFADACVTQQPTSAKIFSTSVEKQFTNSTAPSSPLLLSAANPYTIGPYRYQPASHGDRLLVKISLQFETLVRPGTNQFQLNCQLVYSTDWDGTGDGTAATWTPITTTLRQVGVYATHAKGSMTIAHSFISAITNSVYFGLIAWDGTSPHSAIEIDEVNFYAISYTR